jgi:site-specific DNA-methyltransferase (adenine-specific)
LTPEYSDEQLSLYRGDCLAVLETLPAASIDAVVTDPPYSSGGAFRSDRMQNVQTKYVQTGTNIDRPDFAGDNRDQRAYGYWSALWLSECLRIVKPGGLCLVFADWRQLPTTTDALQAGGWVWRGVVVWDKTEGARPVVGRFTSQSEYIAWGSHGPMDAELHPVCLPGVYRYPVKQADKFHVTGKPTDLMKALLRIVPPGGVVLDPFVGSGTTLAAAKALGLRAIGIEIDDAYQAIAKRRGGLATHEPELFRETPARPAV